MSYARDFCVIIDGVKDGRKIDVVKAIRRLVPNTPVLRADDIVDFGEEVDFLPLNEAFVLAQKLEKAGAVIRLEDIDGVPYNPMVSARMMAAQELGVSEDEIV